MHPNAYAEEDAWKSGFAGASTFLVDRPVKANRPRAMRVA